MRLLFIRHAIAVPAQASTRDEDRPLTTEGEKSFRQTARMLARVAGKPRAILASPHLRARQTAAIAAQAWGNTRPIVVPALAEGDWPAAPSRPTRATTQLSSSATKTGYPRSPRAFWAAHRAAPSTTVKAAPPSSTPRIWNDVREPCCGSFRRACSAVWDSHASLSIEDRACRAGACIPARHELRL